MSDCCARAITPSFNLGIASNAMNESVMKGALNEDPHAFATDSNSLYLVATVE